MSHWNRDIRDELMSHGADLVGFADLRGLPDDVTGGLPRAVSIGVRLDPAVIAEIATGPTRPYFADYQRANALIAELCERAARRLTEAGHQADPVHATTEHFDPVTLSTRVQHKTVATRAGLGWVGKSALLITEDYGPALRLGSVLTDAEFDTGTPIAVSKCGACRQCVDHCPAQAIVGKHWEPGAPRRSIYDAAACRVKAASLAGRLGIEATICGICISVCPWTQRYIARQRPPAEVQIIEARAPEDLETARELFAEYETELPFDLSFQNFEEELQGLPGRYARPAGRILLARAGDSAVGCVALRSIGEGVCEMKRLYVRPERRGQGIGRTLGQAIIERARQIGYNRMRLDTVLEPALSLYRALGFVEIPPYQHVPIDGVVFMERKLT